MSRLLLVSTFVFLVSCSANKSEPKSLAVYHFGKQQLNLNQTNKYGNPLDPPIEVVTLGDDTVKNGEKAHFKTFLNSTKFKLLRAFIHCQVNDNMEVDTTNFDVSGCTKELLIIDDTVNIEFRAGAPGWHDFVEMVLISKDNEGILRYHKSTFKYLVTE